MCNESASAGCGSPLMSEHPSCPRKESNNGIRRKLLGCYRLATLPGISTGSVTRAPGGGAGCVPAESIWGHGGRETPARSAVGVYRVEVGGKVELVLVRIASRAANSIPTKPARLASNQLQPTGGAQSVSVCCDSRRVLGASVWSLFNWAEMQKRRRTSNGQGEAGNAPIAAAVAPPQTTPPFFHPRLVEFVAKDRRCAQHTRF